MVAYTKPQQKEERSEKVNRREIYKIKFTGLRFEIGQVVGFRKAV